MNKASISFYGQAELLKQLESAGANVEEEIIKAIRKSAEKPSDEMLTFIRKRNKTGMTEKSWTETIKNKKGVITAEFGFSVRKGGIASIFWEHGTPRKTPSAHYFVSNAIEKNIDEIIQAQNEALKNAFRRLI